MLIVVVCATTAWHRACGPRCWIAVDYSDSTVFFVCFSFWLEAHVVGWFWVLVFAWFVCWLVDRKEME